MSTISNLIVIPIVGDTRKPLIHLRLLN